MGLLMRLASIHIPVFIRKRKIANLLAATADAFGREQPEITGFTAEERLRVYALFTKEQAEIAISNRNESEIKFRLYRNAYRIGRSLRGEFGVKNAADAMNLARLVYGIVGIDFKPGAEGKVIIPRCYFSPYYSPKVCGVISALDSGLMCGMSGGGRLTFQARITEGAECCSARLSFGKVSA